MSDPEAHRGTSRRNVAHRRAARPRWALRIFAWTAGALAFVLLVVAGYAGYNYVHLSSSITRRADVIPATPQGGKDLDGKAMNILLVGVDERPPGMTAEQYQELSTTPDGSSENTDTMILLHVPADGSSASLISFPRDSYVPIPGHGKAKMNAAYVYGMESAGAGASTAQKSAAGMKLLIQTVQSMTGLTVDHYVKVTLLSFYGLVQALGPVTVCLKNAVNDPWSGAVFHAGINHLNPTDALRFVRQRHGLPNGDLDRAVRQQYFLSVEAQQILSAGTLLNPVKLNNVVSAVGHALEMDSGFNLISFAAQMRHLRGGNIRSATIPLAADQFSDVAGIGSVVNVDWDTLPGFIAQVIGQSGAPDAFRKATAAAPASVTVDVLNGAGTASGSSDALATLGSAGFQTGRPADAPNPHTKTTIYYPLGTESQAKAVASYVPGAAVATSPQYTRVTVVLGSDGIMPQATPQTATASAPPATPSSPSSSPSTPAGTGAATPTSTPATHSYNAQTCID
ncbi:MAG TPA: LCP family protein [Gryllotalpicola sp.]